MAHMINHDPHEPTQSEREHIKQKPEHQGQARLPLMHAAYPELYHYCFLLVQLV
jgi:hypothetical protein